MSAKKNWLWGCGIGCVLLLLIAIAIPVAGGLFLNSAVQGFDSAVASREALEARFGESDAFRPWPAGAVPPDRVEAFLQVREASQPARIDLSSRFASIFSAAANAQEIDQKGFMEKLRFGLGMAKTGAGMAPAIGNFFDSRNSALLDVEMGLGEYTYLYSVAYYGLLERSPNDGPADAAKGIDGLDDAQIDINSGMNSSSRRVRRDLRTMLKSQLAALPDDADPRWREALAAEIATLESQRQRMPWQDGLPDSLRVALEPFRDRMAATYDPITNPFELARNEKRGKFSFTTD